MKLLLLYRRRWWLFYLPVLVCAAAALWWSVNEWRVLPPNKVVIYGGSQQGSYARIAQNYATELERMGISADIAYGNDDNASLGELDAASGSADVGFANGINADPKAPIQALAVIGNEPVWVFSSLNGPSTIAQAKGMRIAAGPQKSVPYAAARLILNASGVADNDVRFDKLTGVPAADALVDGKVDMVFLVAGEDAQAIRILTRLGGIQLLGIENAATLAAKVRAMQPLLLPQGAIELRGDVPPRDLTLMSMQTHLLAKPGLHPALQRALVDAAFEIHQFPTFLQRHGQFPSFKGSDFKLSPTAQAYSLAERPWLETMLPYRKAQYAELILYAVLPILLVLFLTLSLIPKLFDWRVRAALNHFYGELKFLESDMDAAAVSNPMAMRGFIERLGTIEKRVAEMNLPNEFSDHWYILREHLGAAQDHLLKLRAR